MKIVFLLSLLLSSLMTDTKLISGINQTLQKVILESNTKTVNDIKISYDPFNINIEQPIKSKIQKKSIFSQTLSRKHPSKLVLSMILNKKAFINGKWYKEDETIADYKIMKIDQDTVFLKKNSKSITLKLPRADMILVIKEGIWCE